MPSIDPHPPGGRADQVPAEVAERAGGAPPDSTAALVESATQIVAESPAAGGAGTMLPIVLSDVPVAILLIDLTDGTVTYANREAVAMAAHQHPPVPLDQWGAAARLTDLTGEALEDTANPLSRLATGHPVAGEAVLAPGEGDDPRTLWVTGFPLSPAEASEQLALVVLLEVRAPVADPEDRETALQLLRDRAIIATDFAFTITDPRQADNPLVWVNPAFTRVTGYELEDVVGRNCRLLQGPATDPTAIDEMREAVRQQRPLTKTVLNYRKDGTAFWNQVSISPVFDADDQLVSYVGVQTDVTERVLAEAERERAYDAERTAREDAEHARHRLALLAEASAKLASTLDIQGTMEGFADLLVPALADWVVIRLTDEQGVVERTVARHREGRHAELATFAERSAPSVREVPRIRKLLENGVGELVAQVDPAELEAVVSDPEVVPMAQQLGMRSIMWIPLVARRRQILGTLTLVSGPSGRVFGPEDLEVATELGWRAGLTIDNARLYEREHHAAETLQRSLLPDVPQVRDLAVAARYLTGDSDADVGGDWYEVLPLPDGSVGIAVGDVVGHDLSAAAAMGHLRGVVRACAWNLVDDRDGDAGSVLEQVDRLMQGLHVVPLATLAFGRLERPAAPGAPWRFQYASAGHPPMLLRRPDGTVVPLEGGHGTLLGVGASERTTATVDVEPGSVLVAYTDGLIERRGESLDDGLSRLEASLSSGPVDDPERLVDRLIAIDPCNRSDDTAVLVVRVDDVG